MGWKGWDGVEWKVRGKRAVKQRGRGWVRMHSKRTVVEGDLGGAEEGADGVQGRLGHGAEEGQTVHEEQDGSGGSEGRGNRS